MSSVIVYRASGDALDRLEIQANSLDDVTLQTGHGVYTVFRLYPEHRVFRIACHFERLRHSAGLLKRPFLITDNWLRQMLRRAVEASGLGLARVRLTIPFHAPDTSIIALEPFTPPNQSMYGMGVCVGLVEGKRESPRAKNSRFIEWRQGVRSDHRQDVYEIVMHGRSGAILEGLSSSFFAVLDGELHTACNGVLRGISRAVLLEVAPSILPVALAPIRVADLPRVSEAMLTSASRGVVPIVRVSDVVIGSGKPGPVVEALRTAYDAKIEQELEPL